MILLCANERFAERLDEVTPGRTISQTGSRFVVHDADTLTDADKAVIRALVREHGGTIEGDAAPKALTHGAEAATQAALLRWAGTDAPTAYPRLERIDTVGVKGFVAREAWYRPADVDYGLATTPKAGTTPVYEIVYSTWTWGALPASSDTGITERGSRTRRWYAEDGSVFAEVVEDAKAYSYAAALSAGARRRINVVGSTDNMTESRVARIVLGTLLATFPGEDPGPRVAALLGALDGPIRAWRASGQVLVDVLTDPTSVAALQAAHPWLVDGVLAMLVAEVETPAVGEIVP